MDDDSDHYRLNLGQAARVLQISETTLREWLARFDDIPAKRWGSNGVPYEFDARELADWKLSNANRIALEAEGDAEAERERMASVLAELFGSPVVDDHKGLSAREIRDRLAAENEAITLARKKGELIRVADIPGALEQIFVAFRADLLALPDKVGRELNLETTERAKVEQCVEVALKRCVTSLRDMNQTLIDPKRSGHPQAKTPI